MKPYEKGIVKVVWIEMDKGPDEIYSKMFNSLTEGIEFAKDKENFLVFGLVSQKNMEEFSWQLLPFGKYKLYHIIIKAFQHKLLKQINSFS